MGKYNNNNNFETEGSVSEWNEGNFKNLRLHEAQEMINCGKTTPFSTTDDGMNWNFTLWKAGIDILYGEGDSKYSDSEITEVEKIKGFIEKYLKFISPFKRIVIYSYYGKKEHHKPIPENQTKISELLSLYEKQVKKYNDLHGLSTRNREDWDEGL